ncbi:MAG TPA: aminotransferase class I/II-fold pyridoxal phosphate-dependent enzyme [Roseiflexaceae bacterium]|nr:aminotransferase class I/II-fold pyridoxal phosphate-dependent enzyme [Roseiflexaceae bacterium]
MRDPLARRVAGFGTSIFSEITALALRHGAVNLGQGFPDFAGPEFVKRAAAEAIAADLNQYAPAPGLPRLRQAVAAQWERDTGRAVDWEREVTVTSGATEGLCDAMLSLLDPGDRAIVFAPAYDAYIPDITMAGAEPLVVRLHPPERAKNQEPRTGTASHEEHEKSSGSKNSKLNTQHSELPAGDNSKLKTQNSKLSWWFDPEELRAAFRLGPRLIVVNTPHNPTGKVFSRAELELIAGLCVEHDVIALCDEVYDRMTFDGAEHVSLATLPGMWERTLTLNSAGKTFSVTGWKIGYAVGGERLNHALRQAHQWVTFATATPLQQATAVAIEQAAESGYYAELRREYAERRDLLRGVLEQAGLPTLPVEGAYFISADIGALGHTDDLAFCRALTSDIGVAAIPTSVFYPDPADAPPLARFCFAKRHETILAAGERLVRLGAQQNQERKNRPES